MKIIAIPVSNAILSRHFAHCEQFYLYSVQNNEIQEEQQRIPPPHEPGVLPEWLAKQGVTDVIAGGMGQRAIQLFNSNKINVYVGAPAKGPKELVTDFLNHSLQTQANLCDH